MAAGFEWAQSNGSGGTVTIIGTSGNICNFKNADDATAADYASNPITAGNDSYEMWLRAHFIGTFNIIRDVRFWQSTNFSPATGLQVFWKNGGQTIFLQPASSTSSIATSSIPTTDPGSANVGIGGNLSGSLVASGYTDFIVMQLRTTTAAAAGDTSLTTVTLSYSEN